MLTGIDDSVNIKLISVRYRYNTDPEYFCASRDANGLILYVRGGHERITASGEDVSTRPFDLLLLPYGSAYHSRVAETGTEYFQIDFDYFENGEKKAVFDSPRIIASRESERYIAVMRDIFDIYVEDRPGAKLRCISRLTELLSEFVKNASSAPTRTDGMERIVKSVDYIRNHYHENTSLAELAKLSDTCVSNLEKSFVKLFGMSPVEYRNRLRIEHAKMLLSGGFSIAETAMRTGFSDVYYFSRVFKKYAECTPGQYRPEPDKLHIRG